MHCSAKCAWLYAHFFWLNRTVNINVEKWSITAIYFIVEGLRKCGWQAKKSRNIDSQAWIMYMKLQAKNGASSLIVRLMQNNKKNNEGSLVLSRCAGRAPWSQQVLLRTWTKQWCHLERFKKPGYIVTLLNWHCYKRSDWKWRLVTFFRCWLMWPTQSSQGFASHSLALSTRFCTGRTEELSNEMGRAMRASRSFSQSLLICKTNIKRITIGWLTSASSDQVTWMAYVVVVYSRFWMEFLTTDHWRALDHGFYRESMSQCELRMNSGIKQRNRWSTGFKCFIEARLSRSYYLWKWQFFTKVQVVGISEIIWLACMVVNHG